MRQMPDNAFDLAVVDPPYGAGFTEGGGCQGWFTKYNQRSQSLNVERERERERAGRDITVSEDFSRNTKRHSTFGLRKTDRNYEAKKEEAKEERKK